MRKPDNVFCLVSEERPGALKPQGPDTKAASGISPSTARKDNSEPFVAVRPVLAAEDRRKLLMTRRGRFDRPLAILAAKEAALHAQSKGLVGLSAVGNRRPDPNLLVYQIANTLGPGYADGHLRAKLKGETISLYSSLRSRDPLESMLDRILVGLTNATMDSFARAARAGDSSRARETSLRYGLKAAEVFGDLMKLRDGRSGQTRGVKVGNVQIEAGGKAIAGTVRVASPVGEARSATKLVIVEE
jgi:hypothetical protein